MKDSSLLYSAVGFFVGAAVVLGIALLTLTKAIKSAVSTLNGRTLGVLAELAEGRRIARDVPESERTVREQQYVAILKDAEESGTKKEQGEDDVLRRAGKPGEGPVA